MANESTISMHRGDAAAAGSNPNPTNTETAAQPSSAKNIFDLLGSLATPSNLDAEGQKYLDTVTFWNLADADSWLGRKNGPLLFDFDFRPKQVYRSVVNFTD